MKKQLSTTIEHDINFGTIQVLIDAKRKGLSKDRSWRRALTSYTAAYECEMQHLTGTQGTPEHVRKKYTHLMKMLDKLKPSSSEAEWGLQEAKVIVAANHHLSSLVKWARDAGVDEEDIPVRINQLTGIQRMVVAYAFIGETLDDSTVDLLQNKWTRGEGKEIPPVDLQLDDGVLDRCSTYMKDNSITTALHGWAT